ncbi:hypothetical protein [Bifidobacterium aerophilum]|uniref:Uncharacterized protein n=1 Tax=Bifidobacterium aerophilum TaxID=1798155 RepID=A0A6N9Z6X1_9BIFI|nr:hypothetical protein [Bifidobacterium aerophilum]NEG90368.1 hypothetical protein [Bifidobacterium aerophilum]
MTDDPTRRGDGDARHVGHRRGGIRKRNNDAVPHDAADSIPPVILAAIPSWKPTVWTFLVPAVLVVVAAIGGYLLGGVQAISSDMCMSDALSQVNGRSPSPVDYPTYDGPELTRREAAQYYAKAVTASWQTVEDALPTLAGDDLNAIHEQAGTVADALHRSYAMLLARTWPDDVTDDLDDVVKRYGNLERSARYAAESIVAADANDLMRDLISFGNHADAELRDDLGLPAGTPFTPPFDIVAVTDQGVYDAAANEDDRSINDGKRIVDVTVRSRVPGTLNSVNMSVSIYSAIGRNVGTADGGVDGLALRQGQSVVVPVAIDPDLADGGATLALKTIWTHGSVSSVMISLDVEDGDASGGDVSVPAADSLSRLGVFADFRLR